MKTSQMVRGLFVCGAFFAGCKAEEKKQSGSSQIPPVTVPPTTGTGTGTTGTDTAGGTTSTAPSGPAKTKAQCNDAGTSWVAVVNQGQSPATCGAQLSNWGCCKEAILARFPTLAQDIGGRIDTNVNEGYTLYNCSTEGERTHKVHFAKFPGSGRTEYREISVDSFAYDPKTPDTCPKLPVVNFPDPDQYASSTSGSTATPNPSASPSSGGSGTTLTFSGNINRIIKDECATSGCHGKTGAASTVYEDNESNFKGDAAKVKDRISRAQGSTGVMPTTRALSRADKDSMIEFLNN